MSRRSHATREGGGPHDKPARPDNGVMDTEYRVGPGRPPKEFQFRAGQSGNPKGAKRKPRSIVPDVKAMLETALHAQVRVREGNKERSSTKLRTGLDQLANQFAKGDRHARRDVFDLAARLGIDLLAGQGLTPEAVDQSTIAENDAAILADYVSRQRGPNDQRGDETNANAGDPQAEEHETPSSADRGEKES